MMRHWPIFFLTGLLSACGGGGGGGGGSSAPTQICTELNTPQSFTSVPLSAAPSSQPNSTPVIVEAYPTYGNGNFNIPYVTLQVCNGTHCVTVDHVIVDTGSYGLRVRADFPGISTLGLPSINNGSTAPIAECSQFLSGYAWGGVYSATVKIAGEATASPIPIQLTNDPNFPNPPASCTSSGSNIGGLNGLGGNGLLGIGVLIHDTGPYYACSTNGQNGPLNTPLNAILTNPIVSFASDNNGSILVMPSLANYPQGEPTASGTLYFGINTQSNNTLNSTYSILPTPATGGNATFFSATLNGQTGTYPTSFLDSGSNELFIPPLQPPGTYPLNSNGDYVPQSLQTVSGSATSLSVATDTAPLSFSLLDVTAGVNAGNTAFYDMGTTNSATAGSLDLGMPYFYGHSIVNGINGAQIQFNSTTYTGPFYAIH